MLTDTGAVADSHYGEIGFPPGCIQYKYDDRPIGNNVKEWS